MSASADIVVASWEDDEIENFHCYYKKLKVSHFIFVISMVVSSAKVSLLNNGAVFKRYTAISNILAFLKNKTGGGNIQSVVDTLVDKLKVCTDEMEEINQKRKLFFLSEQLSLAPAHKCRRWHLQLGSKYSRELHIFSITPELHTFEKNAPIKVLRHCNHLKVLHNLHIQ